MESVFDPLHLCNFDDQHIDLDNVTIKKLWSNDYSLDNKNLLRQLLELHLETEKLQNFLQSQEFPTFEVFKLAVSVFLKFMNQNWSTDPESFNIEEYIGQEWPREIDVTSLLQRDSETLYDNILHPELLYLSAQLMNALYHVDRSLLNLWWCFRIKVVHQRALEDTSATLFKELQNLIAGLQNECSNSKDLRSRPRLKVLAYLEISQAYLMYGSVEDSHDYLLQAMKVAGLKLELTGIMGKRTKFQQISLPQLALFSTLDFDENRLSAEQTHGSSELPHDVELNDDVRLSHIQYNEKIKQTELPSLEQAICLVTVQFLQKAQPKDDLMEEELKPYIDVVLSQAKGAWSTRVATLLIRCKLEASHKRTVERAMLQCDSIVNDKTPITPSNRLSYIWASGLQASWKWKQQLADLYLSLGLTKAALQLYEALQLWEDVILCYTLLQLRHKAAEVIRGQIDIQPTVKLYCLLGDATDDIACYEKAWEFSNHKSSRAQRHWANYLYERKEYAECIPHYQKSLEINSLQERVWLRLAYAALQTEQWEISANAYRRYTYIQPNSFEAWNNLAKVYVKQGDKLRAYHALMESLKFNYDNWKIWENVIVISLDTGHFDDVIRGVHRILDLQGKFGDTAVLGLLVRAVLEDRPGVEGVTAGSEYKRVLELFARVTSVHPNKPELWQLYSELSPTYLTKAQRLLKAYKSFMLSGDWSNSPDSCAAVVVMTLRLLECSLQARQEAADKDKLQADQQLSSARLTECKNTSIKTTSISCRLPSEINMRKTLLKLAKRDPIYVKITLMSSCAECGKEESMARHRHGAQSACRSMYKCYRLYEINHVHLVFY